MTAPAAGGPGGASPPLHFGGATLILYRLLDVADDIDLDRSESLLAGAATRLRLSRERSEYLEILHAPLTVHLGQREIRGSSGKPYSFEANARLFAFGAVSIRWELPLPDRVDSLELARLIQDFEGSRDVERAARAEAQGLCQRVGPALDTPHAWEGIETYAVVFARSIGPVAPASSAGADPRIAKILLADTSSDPLSAEEVRDATQHRFSYRENDLCIIDWNAAVVIEPDGSRDIPDVLEFATAQLLEFRFYDDLVDREMESLYALISRPHEPWFWWFGGRHRRLGRQLNRRLLETVEFVERVDNALKVIADSYLARVYNAALACFRVPSWLGGVNRKQDLTRQVAEVLSGESQAYTGHLLEIIIILLIFYEIIAPILRKVGG